SAGVNASQPKGLSASGELATIVFCGQSEGFRQRFETQPFRVECGGV
ncbi:MAG: hypothetical protein RLZZ413_2267, partial [Pseudomonadota bacterium]